MATTWSTESNTQATSTTSTIDTTVTIDDNQSFIIKNTAGTSRLTVDNSTANVTIAGDLTATGNLIANSMKSVSSNDIILDSADDIILDVDGTQIFLKDGGSLFGSLTNSSGELVIKSSSSDTTALTFSGADVTVAGDLKSGTGANNVTSQIKEFGLWDFSPSAAYHHPLTCNAFMNSVGADDFTGLANGTLWGGNGANPVTSLTLTSAATQLVPCLWVLPSDITIDSIHYIMCSDASSNITLQVSTYTFDATAPLGPGGSVAGDLSSGAIIAQTGPAYSNLTPVTTAADRISSGTLTIGTADVDANKAIIIFAEASDTDDMSIQINLKYHYR
jgi:hypothetical protein